MAGVVPGLLLTAMFMAYVGVHALVKPEIAPRERGPQTRSPNCSPRLPTCCPLSLLIGGTMGSIYFGLVTPTEAAAVGCVTGARHLG